MEKRVNHYYEFGSVRLDASSRLLYKDGVQVSLQPKVVETLLVLVRNARTVVDKETLLNEVWPNVIVEEGGLKRNISLLRKALGEEGELIETLPKRGYRFTAEVREIREDAPPASTEGPATELSFQRSTDVRIPHEREEETIPGGAARGEAFETAAIVGTLGPAAIGRRVLPALVVLVVLVVVTLGSITYWRATREPVDTAAGATVRSIAVLPFKTLGSIGEEEYLELGLADVLITALSNSREINVRPTSSILKYGKGEREPLAIGRELKVDAVLEGSIHRVEDRIRVTVRLMNIHQEAPLWAGKFDEPAADLLKVQDSIARRVANALRLNLAGTGGNNVVKGYTDSPEAFKLYVQGRFFWNKRTVEGYWRAIKYFEGAVTADPDFALAYTGIADSYALLHQRDALTANEAYSRAEEAARKALAIDPALAEAHASMGLIRSLYHMDLAGTEESLKRAIELNPRYAIAHGWYGFHLVKTGRFEESEAELRHAQELDPTSLNLSIYLAWHHYYSRQYDRAIDQAAHAMDLDPQVDTAYLVRFWSYEQKGSYDQAVETAAARMALLKSESVDPLKRAYRESGIEGFWLKYIDILREQSLENSDREYWIARWYALLGKYDLALKELEAAYGKRIAMTHWAKSEPAFDGMRADPRFVALLQRMGLQP